ncbi:MAG: TnpV protein [Clostridia bacterium]|nr:TnpV protein [Clostridia bacterium]
MTEREGVTEQLKADNQMEWVVRMNNIRSRATEIVNHDIIIPEQSQLFKKNKI